MLSNPTTSSLHARQRAHRRQNSTPSAFEAAKIPALPITPTRSSQHHGHRRGLSLDARRAAMGSQSPTTTTRQDFTTVSNSTNQGLATQHHVLREAQQQRLQARPGPHSQQHHHHSNQQQFGGLAASDHENYLISPHGTPHAQRFDPGALDPATVPIDQYGQLGMMHKNPAGFAGNLEVTKDFELFAPMNFQDNSATAQGWISEGDTSSTRRTSRRISNGIIDRVARFENMGMEGIHRPMTPPNQNANSYFPPTPMETPHDRIVKQEPVMRPNRFSDGYDESMEETIKPTRKANNRSSGIFEDLRQQAEQCAVPTPPRSNTMPDGKMYDAMALQTQDFMSMNNFNAEFIKIQGGFSDLDDLSGGLNVSPDMSGNNSPHTTGCLPPYGPFDNKPDLGPHEALSQPPSPTRSSPSRRGSPHRRTESVASIASAASIASINIEETKTETGVSSEDIAAYIRGPDPGDGKWVCTYEACNKKFGRKENIKSHVQTHLNDRQYQCPSCQKCFVRQHDLKRHAKIHTGIKPYPCECGNSFARHDALTRHRQRGMCIGAFDGIVRKVVKRGRPRKHRPDMDSRMEKSARTRRKNNLSISSASSQSGYSDSSAVNSPQNDLDMLDDEHFDLMDVAMEGGLDAAPISLTLGLSAAPMPAIADVDAPVALANSPSVASQHSYVSPEAIMEAPPNLPSHPPSPAKSVASQYNTPPELSQSSSPPPARFFDLDHHHNSSGLGTDDGANIPASVLGVMKPSAGGSGALAGTLAVGISDQDEEMLLRAFTHDNAGLVQLDRDPGMLMMSKFDEEFDNSVMFNTSDEMSYFGNA